MTRFFIAIVFSCLLVAAHAEPEPWMKRAEPDTLGLWVNIYSGCPFSQQELSTRLEGELLRARIKPIEDISFYLNVNVRCMDVTVGGEKYGYAVSYGILYGKRANGYLMIFDEKDYGSMLTSNTGAEGKMFIINSISDDFETAVTDYLKANYGDE